MNKNTLNAAVRKYGPLHVEGKAEADVKAEISKDEKGFDEEGVNEIYAAILEAHPSPNPGSNSGNEGEGDKGKQPEQKPEEEKAKKPSGKKHVVVKEFRDKKDFSKVYSVGQDVSHFEAKRLEHLVSIGHVELK